MGMVCCEMVSITVESGIGYECLFTPDPSNNPGQYIEPKKKFERTK